MLRGGKRRKGKTFPAPSLKEPWASTRAVAVLGAGDYSVLRNAQLGKDENDQGCQVTGLSG